MYKTFSFPNVIIIALILLFVTPLKAQRIDFSKNAAERDFHRSHGYQENSYNHNSFKVRIKPKNEFHQKNRVRENQDGSHEHKDSAGPAWSKNPDSSGDIYHSLLMKVNDK